MSHHDEDCASVEGYACSCADRQGPDFDFTVKAVRPPSLGIDFRCPNCHEQVAVHPRIRSLTIEPHGRILVAFEEHRITHDCRSRS